MFGRWEKKAGVRIENRTDPNFHDVNDDER